MTSCSFLLSVRPFPTHRHLAKLYVIMAGTRQFGLKMGTRRSQDLGKEGQRRTGLGAGHETQKASWGGRGGPSPKVTGSQGQVTPYHRLPGGCPWTGELIQAISAWVGFCTGDPLHCVCFLLEVLIYS